MAEHTPGPWTVEYDDDGVEIRAAGDLMGTIIHGGAMDANARLIARSPELLRIVEFLGEWVEAGADVIHLGALYGDGDGDYSLADAVRDALQA